MTVLTRIWILSIWLLCTGVLQASFPDPTSQFFIEKPVNQTVNEGQDILLKCKVGNLQGRVQWTRNGFAMGYSNVQVKQICSRCKLMSSPADGEFNLYVKSVRLGEDENFECQVLPGPNAAMKVPLRAPAFVHIQVAPSRVTLQDPAPALSGSWISLACTSADSNPKSQILWYRGDNLLRNAEVTEDVYSGSRNGTFTTVSKIKLKAQADFDGTRVKCVARHPAVGTTRSGSHPQLEAEAKLDILYPPRPPILKGEGAGASGGKGSFSVKKEQGQNVLVQCVSEGGNPLPEIQWLRNGRPLSIDFQGQPKLEVIGSMKQVKSILQFQARAEDHEAVFSCNSFSPQTMDSPLETEQKLQLNVTFPPQRIVITGSSTATAEEPFTFRCQAFNANPLPVLQWIVNGRQITQGITVDQHIPTSGKYVDVSSDLTIEFSPNESVVAITCQAVSQGHFGDPLTKKAEKEVVILKAPSAPLIRGLPQNKTLREGQLLTLTCESLDGSPKPHLRWFIDDQREEIKQANFTRLPYPKSMLQIVTSREDNNRLYRCEATNTANLLKPVFANIRFNVFFPPKSLEIELERPETHFNYDRTRAFKQAKKFSDDKYKIVMAGELIRLLCVSDSSKPRPLFRWTENSVVRDANETDFKPSVFGGEEIRSVMEFRARPEQNGNVYECFAHNPTIEVPHEISAKITLVVLFKPIFPAEVMGTYTVVEGESRNLSLKATGNPPEIEYAWTFPSSADLNRIHQLKHCLTITNTQRSDAGNYSVTASNSYGDFKTNISVYLDVLYPPKINYMTSDQTIVEESKAVFQCSVQANPFTEDTISWHLPDRPGGLLAWQSRREVSVDLINQTSTLTIHFANREDRGRVVCMANNGVRGVEVTETSSLIINHEPYILKEMAFTKFAVQRGSPAYLRCRSISMPEPSFTWHMTSKLSHITKQVHPTDPNRGESVLPTQIVHGQINTYDSLLKLDNIRTEHYSTVFKCVAENGFGTDEHLISLTEPGRPDKPSQFHIVLTTPNSVRLSWNPGFDGGYNQTFALTVYQQRTGREVKKKTLEVNEMNWWLNETTISNLVPETSYLVRIQAKNKAGLSESYEELFVKTRALENAVKEEEVMPRVMIISIVLVVVMALVLVVVFFYCLCKCLGREHSTPTLITRNRIKTESQNVLHSTSTNPLIESYTPSKYNRVLKKEFLYPTFEKGRTRSNSTSSSAKLDYKELARSLSMPGQEESGNGPPFVPNGDPFGLTRGSCSQHGTLRRNAQRHNSVGYNTTLEDDVFEDSDSLGYPPPTQSIHHFSEVSSGRQLINPLMAHSSIGSRLASSGQPDSTYIPLRHSSVSSTRQLPPPLNGFTPTTSYKDMTDGGGPQQSSSFYWGQSSPPTSPIRPYPYTATLPRKSPGNNYQVPNGHIQHHKRTRASHNARFHGLRKLNSADVLMTSGEDSPPLPPPPPPPMTSFRHLPYGSKSSMMV